MSQWGGVSIAYPWRPTEMKAYLTLRCPICPNRSFRSVNMAEKHGLKDHGGAMVTFKSEWVGLPATAYRGWASAANRGRCLRWQIN